MAGAERVFEIIDMEEEEDNEEAIHLRNIKGEVEFRHVSFSYEKDRRRYARFIFMFLLVKRWH